MKNDLPIRKSLRIPDYDYSTPGAYFITFCTHNRKNTLSHIVGAIHESPVSQLTPFGIILDTVIQNLPPHLQISVDQYVIMPNHVHPILFVTEDDHNRSIHESPLHGRSLISKAVGYIKMNASKEIRKQFGDISVWQRGYHDHVIRNQNDYDMIAKYILENPLCWELDQLYSKEEAGWCAGDS